MTPPSVMMIISRFQPSFGGTERQALLLSKELIRRGVRVEVLTQRYAAALPAEETIEGVPVHRLPPIGTSLLSSGLFLLNGMRYLRNHPTAILHAHMLATPAVMACRARRRLPGSRVVVKLACSGSYGEVAVGRASYLGRRKLSIVLDDADRLVCVTRDVAEELRAEAVPENRLSRIPNGVDTAAFAPVRDPQEKSAVRRALGLPEGIGILFTGRLTRQKRPDLVVEAFLKQAARRPDVFLIIVGEGPDQTTLAARAERAGLGARIHWAGRQSAMAPYYRASDLFVLPSEAEGMSNSLLEAMASGLACIVSDTAMAREMLAESEAILIPGGQIETLTHALDRLADEPPLRTALGQAARRAAEKRFDIRTVAEQYMTLYTALGNAQREAA
jgi:glycosyltransferase involved in cell wall biosynthesis